MKNRLFILIVLIVLLISLGACKPSETEVTGAAAGETGQQSPGEGTGADQAYPLEETENPAAEIENPAAEVETAYPITQDDLGQLVKVWSLTESYIDDTAQETSEKTLAFNSDNTYQITTSDSTNTGTWTARLMANASNLVLSTSEGTLLSYQISVLEADLLVLTSIQDGKSLEEHFTPVNW